MKWRVSYDYVEPHPAGPFRGRSVIEQDQKPQRGEIIPAMMGRARIKTVSRVQPDIRLTLSGLALIAGLTPKGQNWVADNLNCEPWQVTPLGVACETRGLAENILAAAESQGLTVER